MRVLLDATAVPVNRGGVGRYVDELVPALEGSAVELVLAVQPRDLAHYQALAPGARVVPAPEAAARRPVRMAWEQLALPALARRARADVVHSPHYTMPVASPVPVVVTLHDATFFTTPELHLGSKARFFRAATRLAARRASGLVVPSAATRDEVVRLVHADPARFTVALHGVDHDLFRLPQPGEVARLRESLDLGDRPYVAFLGTLEPRKNVPALVRGWVRACEDLAEPPALVLAGGRGWDSSLDDELARVPSHLVVRRPGYLPLTDLPALLGGAAVVAYPSLGEGFGLPVLEAMACGSAVLTTRALSLPEVGGDAVAYCGPGADSIATALGDLMRDPGRRATLSSRASARAATFTWRRSAEAHVDAWERAAAREGAG